MSDPLSEKQRSEHMAKVKGKGNRSTEMRVEQTLLDNGILGWEKQRKDILGTPDFFFPSHKLVLFVDGCFWHGCPYCNRNIPKKNSQFWADKIDANRRRDNRYHRKLRHQGFHVMRVWEHDLKKDTWLKRLKSMLDRIEKS